MQKLRPFYGTPIRFLRIIMNFVKLAPKFFRQQYMYFDLPDYYADNLLRQNNIKVKFISEMEKDGSPYRVIFCSVPKKECSSFEMAMDALEKKMIVCGHADYPQYCADFL